MQSFAIVEADVIRDVGHGFLQLLELLEVHHLGLEAAEEGFHVGVVPTVALAAHADPQLGFIEGGTVFLVGILRPLVGVEDGVWRRWAGVHRHQQGLAHQCRVVTFEEAPADHLAGVVIHDDADIGPLAAHTDVAHIPYPNLVGHAGVGLIEQQVRDALEERVAVAVKLEAPGHARFQAVFPHDPRHPVFSTNDIPGLQGRMDSWVAVGLAAGFVYLKNLCKQLSVLQAPLTVLPLPPDIIATTRDAQLPAQSRHRTPVLVLGYEPERGDFFWGRTSRLSSI
jgi:hypothetical protein